MLVEVPLLVFAEWGLHFQRLGYLAHVEIDAVLLTTEVLQGVVGVFHAFHLFSRVACDEFIEEIAFHLGEFVVYSFLGLSRYYSVELR